MMELIPLVVLKKKLDLYSDTRWELKEAFVENYDDKLDDYDHRRAVTQF